MVNLIYINFSYLNEYLLEWSQLANKNVIYIYDIFLLIKFSFLRLVNFPFLSYVFVDIITLKC